MEKIQIGTVLFQNEHTDAIYQKFQEYFEVDEVFEWLIRYVVSKEPCEELIEEISVYYEETEEKNRKYSEFVEQTAREVYEGLSEEDRNFIYDHPDSTMHHFTLGMSIRNKYILGKELGFDFYDPDELSSDIMSKLASMIVDYDHNNLFYRFLYDDFEFSHLRILYHAITGEYPDKLIDEYAEMGNRTIAKELVKKEVKNVVLNIERFEKLCKKYGLSYLQYRKFKSFVDEYNKEEGDQIIPYDVAVLCSKSMDPDARKRYLKILELILDEIPELKFKLPKSIFNQKDAVLIAVRRDGCLLRKFEGFNSDDEVIRAAVSRDGEAIQYVDDACRDNMEYIRLALSSRGHALQLECMSPYRDNEELVRIALEADGSNIQWASARWKDDFEMAAFAIRHQRYRHYDSVVAYLSPRLQDDLRIAFLDIKQGNPCVESYSDRLKDHDEVEKALIEAGHQLQLWEMSERIREKHGLNDDDFE